MSGRAEGANPLWGILTLIQKRGHVCTVCGAGCCGKPGRVHSALHCCASLINGTG